MKPLTALDIRKTVLQLRRTADELERNGPEALRRATDWATPLRSSGTDPGRGKGEVSDPTFNAAIGTDPNAEQLTLLGVDLGHCFDSASSLEYRVHRIASNAVAENQRAGIGWCASESCERYCDGTASNRLRNGICPSCDQKERRAKGVCEHFKTVWHNGVRTCCGCGVELTEAGMAK